MAMIKKQINLKGDNMSAQNETTTIRISKETKKRLKMIAIKRDITLIELIEEMAGLYSAKTCKPKKN